ncbi:MAG: hypothetical protein JRN52_06130 [Nitrososphaerota archaeon]|nr:hypothetical protein [Nitrososphaerota archaeon]
MSPSTEPTILALRLAVELVDDGSDVDNVALSNNVRVSVPAVASAKAV